MTCSNTLGNPMVREIPSHYYALSIRQPWAYLIVVGQKTIELRSYNRHYRGLLIIHASKKIDKNAMRYFGFEGNELETGCLIGAVELVDVEKMTPDVLRTKQRQHRGLGPFSRSRYGFTLKAIKVFAKAISMPGRLGIFEITDLEIKKAIRNQLASANVTLDTMKRIHPGIARGENGLR